MNDSRQPLNPDALRLEAASGGLASYPPVEKWDDWVEYDTAQWPRKVEKHCRIIPTICFNCEAACGLLGFVEKDTHRIRRFEGNPEHPGSRGRNCAKGPATLNQVTDPERIRYPLKRVGKRGEGKWERVDLGRSTRRHRRRACAKRFKKSGATRSCITSAGPAMSCFIISGFFIPGASTATTATPTFVPPARAPDMPFGRASTGRRRIMPTRALFCCSAHISKTGHYFNPHAQRIIEAKNAGTKICVIDTRLSNTASKADYWISSWPGSEARDSASRCAISFCRKIYSIASSCASGSTGKTICVKSTPTKPQTFQTFIARSKRTLRSVHAGVRRQRSRHRC